MTTATNTPTTEFEKKTAADLPHRPGCCWARWSRRARPRREGHRQGPRDSGVHVIYSGLWQTPKSLRSRPATRLRRHRRVDDE